MIDFTIQFCRKDLYSDSFVTTSTASVKSSILPRIGEQVYNKGNWDVFEIIHEYDQKTGLVRTFVRVK